MATWLKQSTAIHERRVSLQSNLSQITLAQSVSELSDGDTDIELLLQNNT